MPGSPDENRPLKIGSRGSQLALWQARFVAEKLRASGAATEIEIIKTTGDHLQTASLVQAGGKGLFTKEIEEALLAKQIDIAVHSMKDLPSVIPDNLVIAAVPEREDPRDAIVGGRFDDLPQGGRVGTSSSRRAAQLRLMRPDLDIQPIRGNVDTRLRKLKDGFYDAIVVAAAGLRRLGLDHEIADLFSHDQMCPAPGQGALAVETRANDLAREICAPLNHEQTAQAVRCERTVVAELGGGCQLPLGVFAESDGEMLHVIGIVISPDGSRFVKAESTGPRDYPEKLGEALAGGLLARGAQTILNESTSSVQP